MKQKHQQPQTRNPFAIYEKGGRFYIAPGCCYPNELPEFRCANKDWKILSTFNPNRLKIQSTCGVVMEDDYQSLVKRILNRTYTSL
jgi:hypothetical protein